MPLPPDHLDGLSASDEQRLEAIFNAFEADWREGNRPSIEDALPDGSLRRPALIELVLIDQAYVLKSHPETTESYLARFPELADDPEILAELVANEYRLRRRAGDVTPAEDYLGRFPHLADRLPLRLKPPTTSLSSIPSGTTVETDEASDETEGSPRVLPSEDDPRYQNLVYHDQGGLGTVYRARDVVLRREVALKRIRSKHVGRPVVRRRFLREVRLTARLTHQGVAPIYDLFEDGKGRPWYAMRFVEGETLDRAIKAYHATRPGHAPLDAGSLEFRTLLARFVMVCETIDYAHDQGVVHRDLKPLNVILGRNGETIVLDWGLATPIGDDPARQSMSTPEPASPPEFEPLTELGQVIGTLGYMSPEQAKSLPAMNFPPADLYSLGAILYDLLTGRPPFVAGDRATLLEEITRGLFPDPRRLKVGVPQPLEKICLKAMSLEPADRYRSAADLARDLERWAAGDPVEAWREPWVRRTLRRAKRHRTALMTLAGSTAVALALVGWFVWSRSAEDRRADASAAAALARADALAGDAGTPGDSARWERAIAEVRRALERLEAGGSPALRSEATSRLETFQASLTRALADLEARRKHRQVVHDLEEARTRKTNTKGRDYDVEAKTDAYLAAFLAYGIDIGNAATADAAAARIRSSPVAAELIAALDDWAAERPANVPADRLLAIAEAAETDPKGAAVRAAVVRRDVEALRRLSEAAADRRTLGPRFRTVFDALARLDPAGSYLLLEAIRRENPSDFWINHDLGLVHAQAKPPRFPDALRCLTVAIALQPTSPGVHVSLGNILLANKDFEASIDEFRTAVRYDPRYPLAHNNLGGALKDHDDLDEAVAEYRRAIELNPNYAIAHSNLGNAILAKAIDLELLGRLILAQQEMDAAIAECKLATKLDPTLTEPHNNLGAAYTRRGNLVEAIPEFKLALKLNPRNAKAHSNFGHAIHLGGDVDGAMVEYEAALTLDPRDPEALNNLGFALKSKKDFDGAIQRYRQPLEVRPRYLEAWNNLGLALKSKGDLEGAITAYRDGLKRNPKAGLLRNDLGVALTAKNDFEGAIAEFEAANRDEPNYGEAYNNLGLIFRLRGDFDRAAAAFKKTVELDPEFAEAHCLLGITEQARGRFAEALPHLEQGHKLGSARKDWQLPSAQWVANGRKLAEMDSRLPTILEGADAPRDNAERMTLAELCFKKKLYARSTRSYGEVLADQPALANDVRKALRANAARSAVLAGLGRGLDQPPPDEVTRIQHLGQALGWLNDDLAGWAKLIEAGNQQNLNEASAALARWKANPDLEGVRTEEALTKLPDREREGFRALWVEVDSLLKKAGGS